MSPLRDGSSSGRPVKVGRVVRRSVSSPKEKHLTEGWLRELCAWRSACCVLRRCLYLFLFLLDCGGPIMLFASVILCTVAVAVLVLFCFVLLSICRACVSAPPLPAHGRLCVREWSAGGVVMVRTRCGGGVNTDTQKTRAHAVSLVRRL